MCFQSNEWQQVRLMAGRWRRQRQHWLRHRLTATEAHVGWPGGDHARRVWCKSGEDTNALSRKLLRAFRQSHDWIALRPSGAGCPIRARLEVRPAADVTLDGA